MPASLTGTPLSVSTLTPTLFVFSDGLFPGFYPSSSAYPGAGTSLGGIAVSVSTLTATAA
mgnify:CR=1 FL=1